MHQGIGDRVRYYQKIVDLLKATHSDCNSISTSTVQKTVTCFFEAETI